MEGFAPPRDDRIVSKKYAIMILEKNYITPKGEKLLKEELHKLLYKERPEMVKTVTWAASLGDRSENADYIYGKRRLKEIDTRIHQIQQKMENLEVIDPTTITSSSVKFGATVTLEDEDGKQVTYQIVGADESNPSNGSISWQSPLAKSLLGKSEGELVIVKRPKGTVEYQIIKIEYLPSNE